MTDLAPALLAFFLWGVSRGISTCLLVCAPGMIPVMVNEKAGILRALWLGFLLSLPRILLLTALGAAIGFLSFETIKLARVRGAFWWTSIAAYVFLGLLLIVVGARLLWGYGGSGATPESKPGRGKKAERNKGGSPGCDTPRLSPWGRFWTALSARIYPGSGRSDTLFLLWGGVLSLACLAELGLLEGAAAGAISGGGGSAGYSAGLGAALMLALSLGATIPIMAAAAAGGSLVRWVRDKKRLEDIKGIFAIVMIMLGLFFVFREIQLVLKAAGLY